MDENTYLILRDGIDETSKIATIDGSQPNIKLQLKSSSKI